MFYLKRKVISLFTLQDPLDIYLSEFLQLLLSLKHWYMLIYKAVLGKLSPYICSNFIAVQNLTTNSWQKFKVPLTRTTFGLKNISQFGTWPWDDLLFKLRMGSLIPC